MLAPSDTVAHTLAPLLHREYRQAVTASSAKQLLALTGAEPLRSATCLLRPDSIRGLPWPDNVLCTRNFLYATNQSAFAGGRTALNLHLRPVGAMLAFSDGTVLLVSEREADALVAEARDNAWANSDSGSPAPPLLVNLCYVHQAWQNGSGAQPALALPLRGSAGRTAAARHALTPAALVAAIRLFDGQTTYGGPQCEVYRELRRLLGSPEQVKGAKHTCVELVGMRGKQLLFSHSDLEKACDGRVAP